MTSRYALSSRYFMKPHSARALAPHDHQVALHALRRVGVDQLQGPLDDVGVEGPAQPPVGGQRDDGHLLDLRVLREQRSGSSGPTCR